MIEGLNLFATFMIYLWPVVVAALFLLTNPRKAILLGYLGALLFLPQGSIQIEGFPELSKISVTALSVFLCILLFDVNTLLKFRPRWYDLPITILALIPVLSSVQNSYGLYDGFSQTLARAFVWTLPYFYGRLYFNTPSALRMLATYLFLGALIYVPFCLVEIRLSPQFHNWVYGAGLGGFGMTKRMGGWRPMVFMQHGLMLGLWMANGTLAGLWLWLSRSLKQVGPIPIEILVPVLFVTTVLCHSTGAILLLVAGIGAIVLMHFGKTYLPLYIAVLVPALYIFVRALGLWDGQIMVEVASTISAERAASLDYRLRNEQVFQQFAMQRPYYGYGRMQQDEVAEETGAVKVATDSMWIIIFWMNGLIGVISWLFVFLLPVVLLPLRLKSVAWYHPVAGNAVLLALILSIWFLDCAVNTMNNPVYVFIVGGLAGFTLAEMPTRTRANRMPVRQVSTRLSKYGPRDPSIGPLPAMKLRRPE